MNLSFRVSSIVFPRAEALLMKAIEKKTIIKAIKKQNIH